MKKTIVTPVTINSIAEKHERYNLLIQNIKDYAMFIVDTKGRVTDWNVGAEHILGYTEEEIVGRNFAIFFTLEDRKLERPKLELQRALETGHAEDDNWLVRKDKSHFWASGISTPLWDNNDKLLGFAKIVRDLTERKHIEQQRDDFISMASHELRVPLAGVKGYAQLLEEHLKTTAVTLDNKSLYYLGKLMDQIGKQEILLRDFLDVSRIQSVGTNGDGSIIEIDELIHKIVSGFEVTISTHEIIIEGRANRNVLGSEQHIGQVLLNLLTNAIKYSPSAKKVVIRLEAILDEVVVSVHDFGIGIPRQQQKRVFDRFFRADNVDGEHMPGYGLGLYIASQIVQQHGGKMWVKSVVGKGSTFYFSLPAL
jgi:PAS domain S-box-containing protein